MQKNTIAAIITLIYSFAFSTAVFADTITIAADVWCPYNCDPNDINKPGFMVDIAKVVFGANGISVVYREIPWARAKKMVSSNQIQGLIAATIADEETKSLIFPKEESAQMQNNFYTLKSSSWSYNNTGSLKKVRVGIINGYDYGPEIQPYIDNEISKKNAPNKARVIPISGSSPLERLIKMLQIKRIDTIIEDHAVFSYTASKIGFTDYRYAGDDNSALIDNKLYIAFSPTAKSKKYAEMLSKGIANLRKSGELSRILAKYSLKDWK